MGANFSAVIEHNFRNRDSLDKFLEELNTRTDLFPTIHELTNSANAEWEWSRRLDLPLTFGTRTTNWIADMKRKVDEAKLHQSYKYSTIWEELTVEKTISLKAPGSILEMEFNPHILELSSYIRWRAFLLDNDLRKICKELCSYMDTRYCIYMSDEFCASDSIYEGRTMGQYREELMRRFGESKQNIADMYREIGDSWETEGYFIERF
ncbi:hypothetical protein [Paenibacillus soyae]|uniref:Uncharacterized protein n=1 Tax=Paenibacillus soyae TaxID=2969249 RepID=A0A9X2MYI8_9BACL|nr:hypothetical protein [Paenibacillus soyae]MCR2805827.1 hypothetical protein [Paenibacillus soyae]